MSKNRKRNREKRKRTSKAAKELKRFTAEASSSYAEVHPHGSPEGFSASFNANAERKAADSSSKDSC